MAVKPMPMFQVLIRPANVQRGIYTNYRNNYWKVRVHDYGNWYQSYEIALKIGLQMQEKFIRESSAFSKLGRISINLLSVADLMFVSKLNKTKCKGITKSQYGYLSGIYERQEREF